MKKPKPPVLNPDQSDRSIGWHLCVKPNLQRVTANTWLKLIHRLIDIGANSKSEKSSVDAIKTLASFLMPRDPVHFLQLIQQQPMTLDEIRARHRELQNIRETMMSLVEGPLPAAAICD